MTDRPTQDGDVRVRAPSALSDDAAIEVYAAGDWVALRGVTALTITMRAGEVTTAALDVVLYGGLDAVGTGALRSMAPDPSTDNVP